jgi:hypothetical protein
LASSQATQEVLKKKLGQREQGEVELKEEQREQALL